MTVIIRVLKALATFVWRVIHAAVNAVYKTTTRAALYLATAWLVVYFTVNSNGFRDELMGILGEALPGQFDVGTLQWGPFPHRVTLLEPEIRDPTGTPVIRAKRVSVGVDLIAMWGWVLRKSVFDRTPFELRITSAAIDGADVLVEVADDGWVGLSAAFADFTKPRDEPTGPGAQVEINGIVFENSRLHVDVPRVAVDGRELQVVGAEVRIVGPRVTVKAPRILIRSGDVTVEEAGPGGGPLRVPITRLEAVDSRWDAGVFRFDRVSVVASRTPASVTGQIDTRGREVTLKATARLTGLTHADPLLSGWMPDDFLELEGEASLSAEGTFRWPHLDATLEAEHLVVDGLRLGPLDLGVHLRSSGRLRTASVDPLSLDVGGAVVHIDRAEVVIPDAGSVIQRYEADVRLDGLVPETLWDLGIVDAGASVPPVVSGRVDGEIFATAESVRVGHTGARWQVAARANVSADWDGEPGLPIGTSVGLVGEARGRFGEHEQWVTADDLWIGSGADQVRLSGRADLLSEELDLNVDATVHVGPLVRAYDVHRISCRATLEGGRVTGRFTSPDLVGRLEGDLCMVYGIELRDLSFAARLENGTLEVAQVTASTAWGRLGTDATIELWQDRVDRISPDMPLELRDLVATGIDLERVGVAGLKGVASIKSRRFRMKLRQEGLALDGAASVDVKGLAIAQESFHHFTADATADEHHFHVAKLDARSTSGGRIQASGTWNRARETFTADLEATAVNIAKIHALVSRDIPLRGTADVSAKVSGSTTDYAMSGELSARRLAYGDIHLGDATIAFAKLRGKSRVRLRSTRFFRRMKLQDGNVELDERGIPKRVVVVADVRDLDVLSILPSFRKYLSAVRISKGQGVYDMRFDGLPTRLLIDLPDRAAMVKFSPDLPPLRNIGPVWGSLVGNMVNVERFVGSFADQKLAGCGHVNLEKQELDLDVAGSVDLERLSQRFPQVSEELADPSGRLLTAALVRPGGNPFFDSCLLIASDDATQKVLGRPDGVLRITGPMFRPSIEGGLRFDDVAMRPRGLGREIGLRKGVIEVRPSSGPGSIELVIPEARPIEGTFEDGGFELTGRARLPDAKERLAGKDWMPERGFLRVRAADIDWQAANEYQLTFDPDVKLQFAKANTPEPELSLGGKVEIVEGAYYKNFSFFTRAVGNVLGRSVDAYSRSLTEAYPFLGDMKLNMEVTGANFLVQSDFGVGKTDIDTRLALRTDGTFGRPAVFGQVEVTDGTITYSVVRREFEVTQGVVTFDGDPEHPLLDLEAETIFESLGTDSRDGCRRADEDTKVTVVVKGRIPDVTPKLSSNQPCSQTDIQYLVLTGRTKAELSQGGGGTPAALEVFSANLTQLIADIINAPFDVNVTPTTSGTTQVETMLRLRNLSVGVTSRENTYDVRYRHKFRDNLELEAVRRGADETRPTDTYEVQLKYRVPLD